MNRLDDLRLCNDNTQGAVRILRLSQLGVGQIRARFAFSRVLLERRQFNNCYI